MFSNDPAARVQYEYASAEQREADARASGEIADCDHCHDTFDATDLEETTAGMFCQKCADDFYFYLNS
jgi:formylmethanofuran dehydrogenase subunit E